MGVPRTTMIQPTTRGANINRLTTQQQEFVFHLLGQEKFDPTEAARAAGYKTAPQAANKLMKTPAIQAILGKEQRKRLERLQLKADDVLMMLTQALFFNPLSLFKPSRDGGWLIEDLDKIPEEIGRCISKIKTKTTERDGESTTYFEIEFMDKTTLLQMALKHCGVQGAEKVEMTGDTLLATLLANAESESGIVNDDFIEGEVIRKEE